MPPFLQTHGAAAGVLRGLRQTVESAGSWDRGRVEELQRELEAIVPDISSLETLAAGLDSSLCKGIYIVYFISIVYYIYVFLWCSYLATKCALQIQFI